MSLQESVEVPVASLGQFFREAGADAIALPRCLDCGQFHWYPMERCPHCSSEALTWGPLSGRATVFSVTTVRYAFTAATRGQTPYGIALVSLDEAPHVRMVCRTEVTEGRSDVAIGDQVVVRVEPDASDPDSGSVRCCRVGAEDKGGADAI